MRAEFFVYPKLGSVRLGDVYLFGGGLGNSLFPWARSVVAANTFGLPMLSPVWERVTSGGGWITAIKTLSLQNASRRTYRGLFHRKLSFRKRVRELLVFSRATYLDESLLPKQIESNISSSGPTVFVFENIRDGFDPLWPHRTYLRAEFTKLIKPEVLASVPSWVEPRFGCHIRLGDFQKTSDPIRLAQVNARLPLAWYACQLQLLTAYWPNVPIEIFSDGTDEELASLLRLPNVSRANYKNAVADLVAMTRLRLLICSGSSFSAWAAFLGNMPTIWFPGKIASMMGAKSDMAAIELEEHQSLPSSFVKAVSIC
jgi:hypothetical protein